MQTFLPFRDFARSAAVLDNKRLGKQRVETLQILGALTYPSRGWANHPATKMWRGHELALLDYQLAVCDEWSSVRGHADSCAEKTIELAKEFYHQTNSYLVERYLEGLAVPVMPPWHGLREFHLAHQSNLIRKDPEFYRPKFAASVPDDLEYVWPVE